MFPVNRTAGRGGLRWVLAIAVAAAFGWMATPAHALSGYTPSMVLTVTPAADTAPNTPCAVTLSGGVYVNSGACGLRGAIDATDEYLKNFATASSCPAVPNPPSGSSQPAVRINVNPGTYALTQGGLVLNGECNSTTLDFTGNHNSFVQIVGAGPATTKVDGSGNAGSGHPASVLTYIVPLQMSGLTITGGQGENFGCNPCGGGLNGDDDQGLSLSNVVITHNTALGGHGGGIYENDWNSASLTNVTISQNAAAQGGGLWNDGGQIGLNNVNISGNIACSSFLNPAAAPWAPGNLCIDTVSTQGGGIWDEAGITMVGGSISGNSAGSLALGHGTGGGVYVSPSFGQVNLTNVTVANNVAGNAGGGVQNHHDFSMTGGKLQSNRSGAIAGGAGDSACDFRSANSAGTTCSSGSGESVFSGTAISGNTAGGTFDCKTVPSTTCTSDVGAGSHGITAGGCPGSLATGEYCFSSNAYGGGIYLGSAATVTGGSISGNTAVSIGPGAGTCSGKGGGIYNSDELLTVRGSAIANNTASCGGGEYLRNYDGNNFYSSRLVGNYASYYGGAFYGETLTAGSTVLNATVVIGNAAGTETGGFYAQAFGTFLLEGATIAGNAGGACPNTNFPCS